MSVLKEISRSAREILVNDGQISPTEAIQKIFDDQALKGVSVGLESELAEEISHALTGYGALQEFLENPEVEEIWCNKPNEVFVASKDGNRRFEVELSNDELRTIVLRMLRNSGRRVDSVMPFADASLEDGSRLHVVIPDVTAADWAVNIRKFPAGIMTLSDLQARGSVSGKQVDYLRKAMLAGRNILISGATHSGKTTMLCALLNELNPATRLITCEETFEIRSNLLDKVALQTRTPNLEGGGEIPLRRLVKEALRMRPGCLVIGEVREAEALDMLIGMNSGIPSACTIHANSPQAAITKLSALPLLAGPNISPNFVTQAILQAVDIVVQCEFTTEKERKVSAIAEVVAGPDGGITTRNVKL